MLKLDLAATMNCDQMAKASILRKLPPVTSGVEPVQATILFTRKVGNSRFAENVLSSNDSSTCTLDAILDTQLGGTRENIIIDLSQ